jgi:membrane associated rhomboid family serine protease
LEKEILKLKQGVRFAIGFVAVLWMVKIIEVALAVDFAPLGIYPRSMLGSVGIFTGPLIHGDFIHLLSNSIPILILTVGLFYFYKKVAIKVFFLLYFMTGIWVWFAAREAFHIGASGLVYGLISFMLFSGFIRRDIPSLSISFAVMVLYGGNMVYGVIPGNSEISWESHFLGMLAGLFCAIYFKNAVVIAGKNSFLEDKDVDLFKTTNYFTTNKSFKSQYRPKKNTRRTYSYNIYRKKQ